MNDRCLVADHFGDEAWHEGWIGLELGEFSGVLGQREETARHGVSCRVVATDDEQRQVADELHLGHFARVLAVRHHRDEVELCRRLCPLPP